MTLLYIFIILYLKISYHKLFSFFTNIVKSISLVTLIYCNTIELIK